LFTPSLQAYLGELDTAKWSLLDEKNPKAGLVLTYTNGLQGRSTQVNMLCDPKVESTAAQE
jgi:hypothetical protein